MIKIITALGNPIINEKLLKNKKIEIIEKDIQYKEAIIEIINKYKKINFIIINKNLPGEISEKQIEKEIKKINNNIKIITINEKEEKNLYREECKKNKKEYNNFEEYLVNIIFKKIGILPLTQSNNVDDDIIKIEKNVIEEIQKHKFYYKIENIKKFKKIVVLYIKIIKKSLKEQCKKSIKKIPKNKKTKIYVVLGNRRVGKSIIIINIAHFFIKKNIKVLMLETDKTEGDIKKILNIKTENNRDFTTKKQVNIIKEYIKVKRNLYYGEFDKRVNIKQFKNYCNKFNIIMIEISDNMEENGKNELLKKCNQIIYITQGNILEIKKDRKILKKYKKKFNINNKKIKIIINKDNKFAINKKIIKKILFNCKILGKIKYNNKYNYYINKKYNNIIFDKKTKNEYIKIIKKLK